MLTFRALVVSLLAAILVCVLLVLPTEKACEEPMRLARASVTPLSQVQPSCPPSPPLSCPPSGSSARNGVYPRDEAALVCRTFNGSSSFRPQDPLRCVDSRDEFVIHSPVPKCGSEVQEFKNPVGLSQLRCSTWLEHSVSDYARFVAKPEELNNVDAQLSDYLKTTVRLSSPLQATPWEHSDSGGWAATRLKSEGSTLEWDSVAFRENQFGSCALVGRNPLLLNQRWGPEIDSHDTVVRVNHGRQAPFAITGNKTTFITLRFLPLGVSPSALPDVGFLFQKESWFSRQVKGKKAAEARATINLIGQERREIIAWDEAVETEVIGRYTSAISSLFDSKHEGKKALPSSGIMYALWLLPLCERLDLYGFNPFPQWPGEVGHFDANLDEEPNTRHNFTREGIFLFLLQQNTPKITVRR